MKIVLLGKNGQVGWELQRALAPLGQVIALDRNQIDGFSGDLSNPEKVYQSILDISPDVVINAAAFTAVDLAEKEQEQADLINHQAVKYIAKACHKINALFIHYSTDYVFNGQGDVAFHEMDKIDPLNIYGKTKALGEASIQQSECKYLIFRTSWVFAVKGKNFLKTMLNLAQQKEELSIINDQIGAPTSAELIADITAHTIPQVMRDDHKQGIYHLVASGTVSWYEYARYIFEQARLIGAEFPLKQVHPIATTAYPTPAKRPLNSRLENQKIQLTFNLYLPAWQQGVKRAIVELFDK
ncbi:dTDP-4-dehydrorhamnose reductase [Acinetobacter gerneri]|uniref:dTDP-4-dehydrorhamnose reductase n=1 Tax=Acinetobacter gerneri TaxID=202952 RepID=UPI003A8C2392